MNITAQRETIMHSLSFCQKQGTKKDRCKMCDFAPHKLKPVLVVLSTTICCRVSSTHPRAIKPSQIISANLLHCTTSICLLTASIGSPVIGHGVVEDVFFLLPQSYNTNLAPPPTPHPSQMQIHTPLL